MKNAETQALVASALKHLTDKAKLDANLERVHSLDDLIKMFQALPWDAKVFSVCDPSGTTWAVEIKKEGPTLTLRPTRHDRHEEVTVANSAFWKQLVVALQAKHPNFRLSGTETFFERMLHDTGIEERRSELSAARQEDGALQQHRRKMREMQRQKQDVYRETKAADHRYMYWLWYQ
jgi:hypothetical protein